MPNALEEDTWVSVGRTAWVRQGRREFTLTEAAGDTRGQGLYRRGRQWMAS